MAANWRLCLRVFAAMRFLCQQCVGERNFGGGTLPGDDDWPPPSDVSLLQLDLHVGNDSATKVRPVAFATTNGTANYVQTVASVAAEQIKVQAALGEHMRHQTKSMIESVRTTVHSMGFGDALSTTVVMVAVVAILVALCLYTFEIRQGGRDALEPPLFRSRREQQEKGLYTRQQHQLSSQTNLQEGSQRWGSAGALVASAQNQEHGRLPPTASAAIQAAAAAAGAAVSGPPHICPSLILPNTEARFIVSMSALQELTTGTLELKGTSGRTLLISTVASSAEGRELTVASVMGEQVPRATVITKPGGAMEVFGLSKDPYGKMEFDPTGDCYFLSSYKLQPAQPVMSILFIGDQFDLKMMACAIDGRQLGIAGRDVSQVAALDDGSDAWTLRVRPGADAVLIASCMLSLLLLLDKYRGR